MLISRIIAGFTPAESDALRKAMGKKIIDKMEAMRVKFVEGGTERYGKKFSDDLFEQMAQFASYGFNKSHSAAYAMIVYQTAYMKANYPTDYMRAVLDSEMDKTEHLVPYLAACRDMGISVLGPDISESFANFSYVKEGSIRFGLNAIKNVGFAAVEALISERNAESGNFASFFDFIERVDLRLCNRRMLESLVYAGCFCGLGYTRKALINCLEMAITHGQKKQADRNSGQVSLFGNTNEALAENEPIPRGSGVQEFDEAEVLKFEKDVLGFYFSGHPLKRYARVLRNMRANSIESFGQMRGGEKVDVAGVIATYSIRPTKNNREMCRLQIEDMSGVVQGIIFPQVLERVKELLGSDGPLLFRATLEKREETGTPQLIVENMRVLNRETLEEKLEKSLHLKLDRSLADPGVIGQIQTILKGYRGSLKVYFHLVNGASDKTPPTVIRVHDSFNVQYSQDMLNRLQQFKQIKGIHLTVGDQLRQISPVSA